MYVRYLLSAAFWIILALIQFLLGWLFLSPWLVVMRRDTYPAVLGWFQPDDTPAIGDAMYGAKEAAFTASYPVWLARYVRSVMWGCRNPAYGWLAARGIRADRIEVELVYGDPFIDIGDFGARFGKCFRKATINGKRYFDWKLVGNRDWLGRPSKDYGYMVRFGWNLAVGYSPMPETTRNLYVDVRPRIKLP
ncbi:MAG: hypothetical protein FD173_925 [Gallionellaceae bacterium]|nr:MAG: hypothetical protein FD173_925 [Gallionellaceae bacterium]